MIGAVSVHFNPNLPWYIARSSGIVAWALITASVIWGLAFSGKLTRHPKLPSPAWMLDLHRFLGGMAVVFMGFHIGGLMMDKYVGYGPAQVAVPLTGTYRPVAVAWGIVAMYLLLTVEVTSLFMSRLPRKVWHGIHLSSFVVFTLATVHGLSSGTDARHGVLPLAMVLAAIVVAMLTGMRAQIAVAKRTERALRAQRSGRAAVAAPTPQRVVRRPAAGDEEDDAPVRRPSRVAASDQDDERPVRPRPSRVAASDDDERPVRQRPSRLAASDEEDGRPVRPRPSRVAASVEDDEAERPARPRPAPERVGARAGAERQPGEPPIGRHARPNVAPAAGGRAAPAERPMAPAAELPGRGAGGPDEQFRPAYEPAAYPPAPYADPRLPAGPYADPRVPAGPYADPRLPAGPYADPRLPAGPYADPRYAGPYPDPRYGPYQDPRFGGAPYDPRYGRPVADPRYPGGPYADPRYTGAPPYDPRYVGAPYADPRYPGGPYADPRHAAGPDPRFSDPGFDPSVARPTAPPAVPIPPMPAVTAGPPMQRPSAVPPPSAGLDDDDVQDAELVEDAPQGASVYPLRPVQHPPRSARPRPVAAPAAGSVPGPGSGPAGTAPTPNPSQRAGAPVRQPAPSTTSATPAGVQRVPADGRGFDPRPGPVERPRPADGRGQPGRRLSADGRPLEEEDIPSERVAGRLP